MNYVEVSAQGTQAPDPSRLLLRIVVFAAGVPFRMPRPKVRTQSIGLTASVLVLTRDSPWMEVLLLLLKEIGDFEEAADCQPRQQPAPIECGIYPLGMCRLCS